MSIAHQRRQTTKPSVRPRDDSSCIVWSHQPSCSLNAHRGESYTQAPVFATSICRQREGCTHVDNLARRSKAEMEESVRLRLSTWASGRVVALVFRHAEWASGEGLPGPPAGSHKMGSVGLRGHAGGARGAV